MLRGASGGYVGPSFMVSDSVCRKDPVSMEAARCEFWSPVQRACWEGPWAPTSRGPAASCCVWCEAPATTRLHHLGPADLGTPARRSPGEPGCRGLPGRGQSRRTMDNRQEGANPCQPGAGNPDDWLDPPRCGAAPGPALRFSSGFYGDTRRGSGPMRPRPGAAVFWPRSQREAEAARAADAGIRSVRLRLVVVLDAHGGALAVLPPFQIGSGSCSGQATHELDHPGRCSARHPARKSGTATCRGR